MEDPFGIEVFLFEQPQCKDLDGQALEEAYQKWLFDVYQELKADIELSRMKDMEGLND
jgi:hypothetical protein